LSSDLLFVRGASALHLKEGRNRRGRIRPDFAEAVGGGAPDKRVGIPQGR
jgi:hypothetical protein